MKKTNDYNSDDTPKKFKRMLERFKHKEHKTAGMKHTVHFSAFQVQKTPPVHRPSPPPPHPANRITAQVHRNMPVRKKPSVPFGEVVHAPPLLTATPRPPKTKVPPSLEMTIAKERLNILYKKAKNKA